MVEQTRTKQTYITSGYRGGTGGDCGKYPGLPTVGLLEHTQTLQSVTSERRVKPAKPIYPNEFLVHKFFAEVDSESEAKYCYKPLTRPVVWTQSRACNRLSLQTQPTDLVALYENVTDNAIVDCFAAANEPSIFDLAPVLFEAKETLSYVHKLFKGLYSVLKAFFKDFSLDDAAKLFRSAGSTENLWLEYRYAIMPLILTISDVIEAFEGGTSLETADARVEVKNREVYTDESWGYNGIYPFNVQNSVQDTVTATARIYIESKCDPAPLGTGIMDVIRGAWEIVPLSFVFNWFVGVEEWLMSMRNAGVTVKASYVTTVVDRAGAVSSKSLGPIEWIDPIDWKYSEYMMQRKVNIQPPSLPLLQAEALSALRVVDAISLLISITKGILSRR